MGVVNGAMNELDKATQQNTSLVGELSRSADALRDSSTRLIDAVGFFRAASPQPLPTEARTMSFLPG